MKNNLVRLFSYEQLSRNEAESLLLQLTEGEFNTVQAAAFMTVFQMRDISLEELQGFRDALLLRCIRPNLSAHEAIDLCGTGGDGRDSFNISTLAALTVAAAGYRVIKHGNYGVSSICGSSNVLEAMGYRFSNDSADLSAQLDDAGICFLHAPLFHPTLKAVASLRRDLGLRSFFNLLGPLCNPVQPDYQLVGVSDLKIMRLYQFLLQQQSRKGFAVLHSADGFDECTLTAPCQVLRHDKTILLEPMSLGLPYLRASDLSAGESIATAGAIFSNVLKGRATKVQHQVVAINAALAMQLYQTETALPDLYHQALALIESGSLQKLWNKITKTSAISAVY